MIISFQKSAKIRRNDDESIDDIAEMQNVRRKADEKDHRRKETEQRKGLSFYHIRVRH